MSKDSEAVKAQRGKRYKQVHAGEWVQPVRRGYKMACCDCGLVHIMDFRIYDGRIQFRAYRNNRSTAMLRRHRKRRESESET